MTESNRVRLEVNVNGESHTVEVGPETLLIDFIRDHLRLTGTKRGCDVQVCGACTVLVQSRPVSSCCYLAVDADGKMIVTSEGLRSADGLSRLQREFIKNGAFQCGYCTPGMLVMAHALLRDIATPTQEDVTSYMNGNLCRCTGYAKIVQAILSAASHEPE